MGYMSGPNFFRRQLFSAGIILDGDGRLKQSYFNVTAIEVTELSEKMSHFREEGSCRTQTICGFRLVSIPTKLLQNIGVNGKQSNLKLSSVYFWSRI